MSKEAEYISILKNTFLKESLKSEKDYKYINDLKSSFIKDVTSINKELEEVISVKDSYISILENKTPEILLEVIEEKVVSILENYKETFKGSDGKHGRNGKDGLHGRDGKDGKSFKFLGVQSSHPFEANENDIYRNYSNKTLYIFNEGTWKDFLKDGIDHEGQSFYSGGGISDNQAIKLIKDYALQLEELQDGTLNLFINSLRSNSVSATTISASDSIYTGNYLDFATPATNPAYREGRIYYDVNDHALSVYSEVQGVSLQVGQELYIKGVNKTGSIIENGSIVFVDGAQGNRPTIRKAIASTEEFSHIIGMATHNIGINQEGYVTTFGLVRDLNTDAYPDGTILYLSPVTSGAFTSTLPTGTDKIVEIGYVVTSHQNQGSIQVKIPDNGHLAYLHDVLDGTPTLGNYLKGNGSYWTTASLQDDVNTLTLSTNVKHNIVSATSAYVALNNDVILCNGNFPVTISATEENIGKRITIKNVSTGSITVSATSGTIDGEPYKILGSQWSSIDVIFDGYNSYIL